MENPEERLKAMGIELPEAPPPAAAYVPWTRSGDTVYTAGQIAVRDGDFVARGIVGNSVDLATAQECARQCAINILAQLKSATGDLGAVSRLLKLNVFVASAPDFTDQHLVANGASEFLAEVFGDRGHHARSAVGVASLPLDSPVEIEAIAEVESP